MTRPKMIAAMVALLVAAAVAWYFASPAYTLSQMRSAAEANDPDKLSAYIDYPALKDDMKAELMAQMMTEAEKDSSGYGGLGLAIGSALIGPMIDGMISPTGMRSMFIAKRNRENSPQSQQPQREGALTLQDDPVITRRGLSEFAVTSKKEPNGAMIFKRHGLSWKLSGVDLPTIQPAGEVDAE